MNERESIFQKKSLGQVFLKTDWPVQRMVERLQVMGVSRVLEIGPGNGILTRALLDHGMKVTAVEKDNRFAARMSDFAATLPDPKRLKVINSDILRYDWQEWIKQNGDRAAVVGNIPYNISSPILTRGLSHIRDVAALMFMTQLEFAVRVVGRPNTKDYGSLSVFTQLRADATLEFNVPRTCFQPIPKVDSAVLLLQPKREMPSDLLLQKVEAVTRTAFMQRRKKLRNSVRAFLEASGEVGCPIDLERRADSLLPREFVALAEFFLQEKDGAG